MFEIGTEAVHRAAGIAGVVCYLAAYGLLQAGVLRGSGYLYTLLNLVAAALVLLSLAEAFNLASALIQIAWIAISVAGLARLFWINHRIRFTEEERDLIDDAFPGMPAPLARRLLNRGIWADWQPGAELTREGETVVHLHYLRSGRADVFSAGRPIAEISQGLIGEMNVMEPGPASATVRVGKTARIFSIPGDTLRRLAANDSDLRYHIERHLSLATRRKLIEANARLADRPWIG